MRFSAYLILFILLPSFVQSEPSLLWESQIWGAVTTDLVYDGDIVYFGTSSRKVIGLNASTGDWVFNYTSTAPIFSKPAITDDLVVFGCDNKIIYAVNKSDGRRVWTFLTKDRVQSAPTIVANHVYIGSNDKSLYVLGLDNGKLLWKRKTGSIVKAQPYVGKWRTIFPSMDRHTYCISNHTGEEIWNMTTLGPVMSSPVVQDETLFMTSSDRKLYIIDIYSGEIIANVSVNGSIMGSPALSEDSVYFSSLDNKTYSVDIANASINWEYDLGAPAYSTPHVSGDIVYASGGANFHAINRTTGERIWRMNLSMMGMYAPTSNRDTVFVADGITVKAYSDRLQVSDLEIVDILVSPKRAFEGQRTYANIYVRNKGDMTVANAQIDMMIDRVNTSIQRVFIGPNQIKLVTFPFTAEYGHHIMEVTADKDKRIVDADRDNNRASLVFSVDAQWTTAENDFSRSGYWSYEDDLNARDNRLMWSCRFLDKNISASSPLMLSRLLNASDPRIGDISLDQSCYLAMPMEYPTESRFANWSCMVSNISNQTQNLMFDMARLEGKKGDNRTKEVDLISMFRRDINISSFSVGFNCTTSFNKDIPVSDAQMLWDCNPRRGFNASWDLYEGAWTCRSQYLQNYSMSELIEHIDPGYVISEDYSRNISFDDFDLKINFTTSSDHLSNPILVELGGPDDGGLEIVFGDGSGYVYAVTSEGYLYWRTFLGEAVNTVSASDLDLDGRLELLVGTTDRIICLDTIGSIKWAYQLNAQMIGDPITYNIDDLDEKEVILASDRGLILALDHSGKFLWSHEAIGGVISSLSLVDINRDNRMEVVLGTDSNYIYVLNMPPYKVWIYQTNGGIVSSPTVTNIFNPMISDIIAPSNTGGVSSLYYAPMGSVSAQRVCNATTCYRESIPKTTLMARWTLDVGNSKVSSPSIADLDGDGVKDIVFSSLDGVIYFVNSTGSVQRRYNADSAVYSSPLIVNLGNGKAPEIAFSSVTGRVYILNASGSSIWTYQTGERIESSPAVADIDGDGILELAITTKDGSLYIFGVPKIQKHVPTIMPRIEVPKGAPDIEIPTTSPEVKKLSPSYNRLNPSNLTAVSQTTTSTLSAEIKPIVASRNIVRINLAKEDAPKEIETPEDVKPIVGINRFIQGSRLLFGSLGLFAVVLLALAFTIFFYMVLSPPKRPHTPVFKRL